MSEASQVIADHLALAPTGFVDAHPELHHYTSFCGLKGIVESGSVWATHYRHLNDSTEVTLLESSLVQTAIPRIEVIIGERPDLKPMLEEFGGVEAVAKNITDDFIAILYNVGFRGEGTTALAEPYVSSFSTHNRDQTYERNNGL
jgi:hypothetical protein